MDTTVPTVTGSVLTLPSGPGQTGRIRIESTDSDVTTFQYGWDAATRVVAASGTNPKYAEVDVTAPSFGRNVLLLKAIDAGLNEGYGSVEFHVGRPSTPIARWLLETYPGIDQAGALADQAPAPADSPLTASNVTWAGDIRLIDARTATFDGTSSAATTSSAVVDTTGSFSVSARVRLGTLPAGDMTFATQDGTDAAGFRIGVRRGGSPLASHWSFAMTDTSAQSSATVAAMSPTALTAADVGRWRLVTGSFDAAEKKLRLYVDGALVAEADRAATPWAAAGGFAVGRGSGSDLWTGSIADVLVFDRVLVPQDFTGQSASDPTSGGFDEPGIAAPTEVGSWSFQGAVGCWVTDLSYSCEAPDASSWDRSLALTRGSEVGTGHTAGQSGLWLDDRYFPEDGNTESSEEYGRSAVKTGTTPPDADGNEFTVWQDRPVLRTDQSYTVSAWAMIEPGRQADGSRTLVAQRGTHESAFRLEFSPTTGKWEFRVLPADDATAPAAGVASGSAAQEGVWTQVTGVYDAARNEIRIYVDGVLDGTTPLSFTPFQGTGSLLVGRSLRQDAVTDQWFGGVDDVEVFQGAMSDAGVAALHNR